MAVNTIKIEGIRELQAALRKMDGESQKQLRVVFNEAAKIVADTASTRVPRRTGRAAASLRAASGQREASVKGGTARAPYYPWLDFGGRVGRNRSVSRPFLKEGRYIYAAFRDRRATIQKTIEDGAAKLIRDSGLEAS